MLYKPRKNYSSDICWICCVFRTILENIGHFPDEVYIVTYIPIL